jgi:GTP-binding protein EngB required for normal cell division
MFANYSFNYYFVYQAIEIMGGQLRNPPTAVDIEREVSRLFNEAHFADTATASARFQSKFPGAANLGNGAVITLLQHLRAVSIIGRMRQTLLNRQFVMLIGPPNSGKSSLLMHCFKLPSNPGLIPTTRQVLYAVPNSPIVWVDSPGVGDQNKVLNDAANFGNQALAATSRFFITVARSDLLRHVNLDLNTALAAAPPGSGICLVLTHVDELFSSFWNKAHDKKLVCCHSQLFQCLTVCSLPSE